MLDFITLDGGLGRGSSEMDEGYLPCAFEGTIYCPVWYISAKAGTSRINHRFHSRKRRAGIRHLHETMRNGIMLLIYPSSSDSTRK